MIDRTENYRGRKIEYWLRGLITDSSLRMVIYNETGVKV